jgi:hypothetical protein
MPLEFLVDPTPLAMFDIGFAMFRFTAFKKLVVLLNWLWLLMELF